jgi:hypothetical protein
LEAAMPTPHAHLVLGFALPSRPADLRSDAEFGVFPQSVSGLFEYPRESGPVIVGQKVPSPLTSADLSQFDGLRARISQALSSQGVAFEADSFGLHLSHHYG